MPRRLLATAFTAPPVLRPLSLRRYCAGPLSRRAYSHAATPRSPCEHVTIPCRTNGHITIDIFHASTPSSPILLYLPPGPVVPACPEEEERVISTLRESSSATIARINYRASSLHPYPTPCHDVLAGYDWIRENLLLDEFKRPYLARLGVCGQLVGASLATMLALTECRLGESRVGAAAVNNPIVDWVFPDHLPFINASELPEPAAPDETAFPADEDLASSWATREKEQKAPKAVRKPRKRTPKPPPLTAWHAQSANTTLPVLTLSGERDMLFRKPEDCFDRFASPIHFFRSPHAQLIFPQQEHLTASEQPDEVLDMETQMHLNHYAALDNKAKDKAKVVQVLPTLARCRSYARNYPPAGTKLSLPVWNITSGLQSPLSDQATELAKMIRRSIARQTLKTRAGRTRWHDATEKRQYEEFAQKRVELNTFKGTGLWTEQENNPNWKANVEEVGDWMKQRLDVGFS
ncbi:uncharacterized protein K460DRAFT_400364 [Cucurbitaria berberidis CBS 394.84]|uniref:Alpha/beta hydrolase fold-3 domain-containing protein n=1 Tax=Cucurbitaria berberidis CBS 394.84 TaxID=1168544 RepID=A0A9P4GR65_9PLEO|nr:uncharacterized protein K460DRAFT_400364 [Cucurbitaria berberidis CBS 394.84]KAF1850292.1 hypothetical protein K460DRAFT_400364 [Cucurbitaria berberidis CBS 394.84]